MATRPLRQGGRDAGDRASSHVPGLTLSSTEVVELVRGVPYVVVRSAPGSVDVLDAKGRLVRRRELLAAIAAHLHAVRSLAAAVAEARLDARLAHAERSAELLRRVAKARDLVFRLDELRPRLETVIAATRPGPPPTERTLRRRIAELNEAARADRLVVREARRLAAEARPPGRRRTRGDELVQRWVVARLASPDLPFVHPELDEADASRFVERFVEAARRT